MFMYATLAPLCSPRSPLLCFCEHRNIEEGAPEIVRIYGTAKIILEREASPELLSYFPAEV
jgi:hypothetical protein